MKLFGKLLIAALVLAVLLPFTFLKGPDGKPLMSIDKLSLPDLKMPDLKMPGIPDSVKNSGLNSKSGSMDVIYKWKDENGELHFSSTPPPDGVEFTSKGYDPNTNLIQAVQPQVDEPEQVEAEEKAQIKKAPDISNPYSPEKVDKLVKDAQNIEKLLNERLKKQEALID